ncbi:MAG: DUF4810 domain-containing protein, partial [Gammaproteobacteria bacterium]
MESLIIHPRALTPFGARAKSVLLAPLAALLFSACAQQPKPVYYWGEYENLLYSMYLHPGEADTTTQVAILTEDIQKTRDQGQRVPPGVHAHLGYMQYLLGNAGAALAEFTTEKELYPESTV